ncbi:MAG: hypothetical protein AB7L09_02175 [Nitrospira sp.]
MAKRRAKGFPIVLPNTHWFSTILAHAYLKSMGQSTPEMDAAAAHVIESIPGLRPDDEQIRTLVVDDYYSASGFYFLDGTTTVRFRGEHLDGAIHLLRAAAFCTAHGGMPGTVWRRVDKLVKIDTLDKLANI